MNDISSLRSMFVGCLLGDAHIGRTLTGSFITFEQALAKKPYLYHLYTLVQEQGLAMNPPVQYDRVDTRTGAITHSLYFRTFTSSVFDELAALFLDKHGKKVISPLIGQYLDIVALSYWICDDGQAVANGGFTMCTDSFTAVEIQYLQEVLLTNFGVTSTLHRGGKRIYIGKAGLVALRPQLLRYVHSYHMHKIDLINHRGT
jgi:hypothetical protein